MNTRGRSQVITAAVAGLLAVATGCGRSQPASSGAGRPGVTGTSFLVTVSRPSGGTVTSRDGQISCGTAADATRCGPASYAWDAQAILIATADAGNMFGTWAGDCVGRTMVGTEYVCTLDTSRFGADKYVVAVFGELGRTQHTNWSTAPSDDPTVHGQQFLSWMRNGATADTFDCAYCHGATFGGIGIAPSCNACHERNGSPDWQNNCDFCHTSPPRRQDEAQYHLELGEESEVPPPNDPTWTSPCSGCHDTTVAPNGSVMGPPAGTHMNGQVDASGGGHEDGYAVPAVHAREFFQFISGGGGLACTGCHGPNYDRARSCDACHAANGWRTAGGVANWETNCSFCHGLESPTTQAGYDLAANPTFPAPPDAISERLGGGPAPERTGAHAVHLVAGRYAQPVACTACHAIPSTTFPAVFSHISGREERALVALTAPGQITPPDVTGYDPVAGTCSTACHGTGGSPVWSTTGLACDGCHGVPATAIHSGLSMSATAACAGCHSGTVDADGTINVAGGLHVNGVANLPGDVHADGFATRTVHGPAFLDYAGGASGALDCNSCHGPSFGFCDSCHSSAASGSWQSWQTNCTFCHGTRTPTYTEASLTLASPPDSVTQRLTGSAVSQARRIGKHREHLQYDSNEPDYPAFPCATCHAVPTNVAHIGVAPRNAQVSIDLAAAFPALSDTEVAALPNGASYDPISGRCSVYCHGSAAWGASTTTNPTPTPLWSTAGGIIGVASCNACHGSPPPTGKRMPQDDYCTPIPPATDCSMHEWHSNLLGALSLNGCAACHHEFVHLNGVPDIHFNPSALPTGPVSGSWDRPAGSCTVNCHSDVIDPAITPPGNPQTWR